MLKQTLLKILSVAGYLLMAFLIYSIFSMFNMGSVDPDGFKVGPVIITKRADQTDLMYAIQNYNMDKIDEYIQLPKEINLRDCNSETALMQAINYNMLLTCEKLVNAGADLTIQNNTNKTALEYALDKGNEKIIKLIKESVRKQKNEVK